MTINQQNQDSAWKDLLDAHLSEFVAFFLPDLYEEIAWEKSWQALDSETHAKYIDSEIGKKFLDKLFELHDTASEPLFIHIEVQGEIEVELPQRIFTYNYRIYDQKGQMPISCVLLTDSNTDWLPDYFVIDNHGCQLGIKYRVIKLLDYLSQAKTLEDTGGNIFSTAAVTCAAALKVRSGSLLKKLETKILLTKRLYDIQYNDRQKQGLIIFVSWIIKLPIDLEKQYQQEIAKWEKEKKMSYISIFEQVGIEKGLQQGEYELLVRQLQYKFNIIPDTYQDKIKNAVTDKLLYWGERVLDAKSLEEVFMEE